MLKVNHEAKTTARKHFTGTTKPKDFVLTTEFAKATIKGTLTSEGDSYTLGSNSLFGAKDMREYAEHLVELADILDAKKVA